MIDPDWDERDFVISDKGQALIDETKFLWSNGVSLDEIGVGLNIDPLELVTLLAMENLSKHVRGEWL